MGPSFFFQCTKLKLKMIMKSPLLLPLYFLSLLAFASANKFIYNSFVNCLASKQISYPTISTIVYTPNNHNFTNALQSHIRNRRFDLPTTRKPSLIVAPTTEAEVSAAVVCAKKSNILLKIRSGGHDFEGQSYVADSDFIILDMFNFHSITVDPVDESAWVESGAQLGELYYHIWKTSETLGFPAGVCPTVGVGGHFSGGGYGNMLRKHGLSVDHIVDARIVVSNGTVLDRASMGEELFWAIRGGGGASFGVILSYKITLVRVPKKVTIFRLEQYMSDNASQTLHEYQQIVPTIMDDDLFIRVLLQPVKRNDTMTLRTTFIGMFLGDAESLIRITDSIFPTLGLKKSGCHEMSWIYSVLIWANFDNTTSPDALLNQTSDFSFLKRKSDYVQSLISISDIERIFEKMIEIGKVGLVFNSYGGKMNDISEYATPFPHRAGNIFKIQYSVNWDNESDVDVNLEKAIMLYKFMTPYVSKNPRRAYLNYRDLDIGINENGEHDYGVKYFKKVNFQRLMEIKTAVDPSNFFRNKQSIPTLLT